MGIIAKTFVEKVKTYEREAREDGFSDELDAEEFDTAIWAGREALVQKELGFLDCMAVYEARVWGTFYGRQKVKILDRIINHFKSESAYNLAHYLLEPVDYLRGSVASTVAWAIRKPRSTKPDWATLVQREAA